MGQVVRRLGVSEQSHYRWRREFGGMRVDQAKRLKELERENAPLKRLVAEQAWGARVHPLRHSNSVLPSRGLARPAGGLRIGGSGSRLPSLGLRPERSATPYLLITR